MSTQSRTILILGANGHLGSAATEAFAQAGWRVFAAARSDPLRIVNTNADAIVRISAGIEAIDEIVAKAKGAQCVLYCANPPYTQWPGRALPLVAAGTRIARELGASFLFPGNVYNFGESMPSVLSEQTAQTARTRKGQIRMEIEAMLATEAQHGLRVVVLRAGDFFGPDCSSWIDRVIGKSLVRGKIAYPGPLDCEHAWAYLPDLARAFVELAQRERNSDAKRSGIEHFGFAGHTLTGSALLAAIESEYRRRVGADATSLKRSQTPWGLYRLLSPVVPILREIVEMEYLWRIPHRIDGTALEAAIGAPPITPLPVALAATLEALLPHR